MSVAYYAQCLSKALQADVGIKKETGRRGERGKGKSAFFLNDPLPKKKIISSAHLYQLGLLQCFSINIFRNKTSYISINEVLG